MIQVKWFSLAVAVLVALVIGVMVYGSWRWAHEARAMLALLEGARIPATRARYNASELDGLPRPVQRYFRTVLTDGQPIITALTVHHAGTFNMNAAGKQWRPFTSTQRVITRRPGFDWDARVMMMPGVPVHVHDAYIAGKGQLHAAVFGLITVARVPDSLELQRGELLRFFMEAAWYPTALLPGQGVRWEAVDDQSAHASMKDGEITLTLLFRFNADGLIDTVRAEARGRIVDGRITTAPWQGHFWNYAIRDGMRVPLQGEVAWVLANEDKPYWRGTITAIAYEFAK